MQDVASCCFQGDGASLLAFWLKSSFSRKRGKPWVEAGSLCYCLGKNTKCASRVNDCSWILNRFQITRWICYFMNSFACWTLNCSSLIVSWYWFMEANGQKNFYRQLLHQLSTSQREKSLRMRATFGVLVMSKLPCMMAGKKPKEDESKSTVPLIWGRTILIPFPRNKEK